MREKKNNTNEFFGNVRKCNKIMFSLAGLCY